MDRNEFLMVRESVLEGIDNIVDELFDNYFPESVEQRYELVGKLADMVCEVMDPVGMD